MVNVVAIKQDATTTSAQFDTHDQALGELLGWAHDPFYTNGGRVPYVRAFIAQAGLLNEYEVVRCESGYYLRGARGEHALCAECGKLYSGGPGGCCEPPAQVRQ